jgi:hypothetical protein
MRRNLIACTQEQARDAHVLGDGLEFSNCLPVWKSQANWKLKVESAVPALFLVRNWGVLGPMHTQILALGGAGQ